MKHISVKTVEEGTNYIKIEPFEDSLTLIKIQPPNERYFRKRATISIPALLLEVDDMRHLASQLMKACEIADNYNVRK